MYDLFRYGNKEMNCINEKCVCVCNTVWQGGDEDDEEDDDDDTCGLYGETPTSNQKEV